MSRVSLNYPLFNGEKIIENAAVTIENGIITDISEAEGRNGDYLLMPGLIDAHTHMTGAYQVSDMLGSGVVATCDVSAPRELIENAQGLRIISSAGMTMGTLSGKGYVKKSIEGGARYIKVLLFEPNLMPRAALRSICAAAHEEDLKVAVHATSVRAEKMAIECGADILLHVPMKEELPESLAREIAERGIAVAPTLVMMEAFAHSGKNGYLPAHYKNAEAAVRTLYGCGAVLLAATDANDGSFAPAVAYGSSMHREMELLCKAGLTPIEVLTAATGNVCKVFGIDGLGSAAVGGNATLILVEGRPDRDITAIKRVRQIWIDGEQR